MLGLSSTASNALQAGRSLLCLLRPRRRSRLTCRRPKPQAGTRLPRPGARPFGISRAHMGRKWGTAGRQGLASAATQSARLRAQTAAPCTPQAVPCSRPPPLPPQTAEMSTPAAQAAARCASAWAQVCCVSPRLSLVPPRASRAQAQSLGGAGVQGCAAPAPRAGGSRRWQAAVAAWCSVALHPLLCVLQGWPKLAAEQKAIQVRAPGCSTPALGCQRPLESCTPGATASSRGRRYSRS